MQKLKKQFHKINIEISNICNLQCSFCPEVIRSKRLMPIELFEVIIKQVAPLTEQVCFHLMGEPLVHPDLESFIKICHAHDVKIFFVTNGVLLRERQSEILLHPAIRQVNISLHSFSDNFPGRDANDYLQRIFNFAEKALVQRPDLYINFRLWNLKSTTGQESENTQIISWLESKFNFHWDQKVDVTIKKSVPIAQRIYLHFDTQFVWPSLDLPEIGSVGTCKALSGHFGILVDGTVVPCCLDKEGIISLGKIPDQSIGEILAGERAQKILLGFNKRVLVEKLCQHCQYIDRFGREKKQPLKRTENNNQDGKRPDRADKAGFNLVL